MIHYFIPIAAGILYALGGDGRMSFLFIKGFNAKLWRWLLGAFIGLLLWQGWTNYGLCIGSYFLATQMPYGENSWLNFMPKWAKYAVCGFAMGLASWALLGLIVGLLQAVLGALAFVVILYLDEKGIIHNPFVEFFRGALPCVGYLFI